MAMVAIAAVASVANADFVYESFNTGSLMPGWTMSSDVSLVPTPTEENGALSVPRMQAVTNNYAGSSSGQKVWTDFYTIPRRFQSDSATAPAIDASATAQVYVDGSGSWKTISGNGTGGYLTNSTAVIGVGAGGVYPSVGDNPGYFHVSVMHDYSTQRWSLFVNELCLATNLYFISSSATKPEWFQVQNYGGTNDNVCYLDEFRVTTNSVPDMIASTNTILTEAGNIPQAVVFDHFNTLSDPTPTSQSVSNLTAGIKISLNNVVAGRTYNVLGTANPDLSGLVAKGTVTQISPAFSSSSVLSGSTTRYFYKIVTVAADGYAVTNSETYACYKQARSANKSYRFGVPVNYLNNAADRTIGGAMGEQLKVGLGVGDVLTVVDKGTTYKYNLDGDMTWTCIKGDDVECTKEWGEGVGFNIACTNTGSRASSTIFAGLKPTNTAVSVELANNWSYLAWPYNDKAMSDSPGTIPGLTGRAAPTVGDVVYIQQSPSDTYIPAAFRSSGGWKYGPNGTGISITNTLHAGDGIIYKGNHLDQTWTPPVP